MRSSHLDFFCPLVVFTLDWFLPILSSRLIFVQEGQNEYSLLKSCL
jgi:hypothetical protein